MVDSISTDSEEHGLGDSNLIEELLFPPEVDSSTAFMNMERTYEDTYSADNSAFDINSARPPMNSPIGWILDLSPSSDTPSPTSTPMPNSSAGCESQYDCCTDMGPITRHHSLFSHERRCALWDSPDLLPFDEIPHAWSHHDTHGHSPNSAHLISEDEANLSLASSEDIEILGSPTMELSASLVQGDVHVGQLGLDHWDTPMEDGSDFGSLPKGITLAPDPPSNNANPNHSESMMGSFVCDLWDSEW